MRIDVISGTCPPLMGAGHPFAGVVHAGFPSPAEEYLESRLDLNEELVKTPSATVYCRVKGTSMMDAGIHDGDILVVDRSIPPTDGKVAVCWVGEGMTLKRLRVRGGKVWLEPANQEFKAIPLEEGDQFTFFGVVTAVVHRM